MYGYIGGALCKYCQISHGKDQTGTIDWNISWLLRPVNVNNKGVFYSLSKNCAISAVIRDARGYVIKTGMDTLWGLQKPKCDTVQ